jgi:DNA-binding beta-propeller fold protein YncE
MRLFRFLLIFFIGFLIAGCKSSPTSPEPGFDSVTKGVYIVNEGNFTRNNSTLSLYLPDSNRVYPDVFSAANRRPLGDVANDMVLFNDRGYIVVNNSQTIEVISLLDQKSVGRFVVPGSKSPYKLAIVNSSKAYVTNLYDNSLTEFDPTSLQIIQERILVGNNPEGIALANGKLYVCDSGLGADSTITVVDPTADLVVNTITVARSPSEIAADANGHLVVKCDGSFNFNDPNRDTPGSLVLLDPRNDVVLATVVLPLGVYGHPGRMTLSKNGYGYFVGKSGVMRFDIGNGTISVNPTPFVSVAAYGLAVDDVSNRLYATDAKDYVQPGDVIIYGQNGEEITRFLAGIIPGTIVFKR